MEINFILFLISLIIVLGYLAEWIFKKTGLPDILILIMTGFILGPGLLNFIRPEILGKIAPVFTTFTLLFLIFEGALYIDLKSFSKGLGSGIIIGISNFFISVALVTLVLYLLKFELIDALILGFSLGGVSAAFIIPLLKQIKVSKNTFSVLTLEGAFTDVLAIVFAITIIDLKLSQVLLFKNIILQISAMLAIAIIIGIAAGFCWILLEEKVLEPDKNYIMTIAYVVIIYFLAEFLGGSGAIASLFTGLVMSNSRSLVPALKNLNKRNRIDAPPPPEEGDHTIVSRREKLFYNEISFLLKTFFFVYIGLLLNIRNTRALIIGSLIALGILILRNVTTLFTGHFSASERTLFNSVFARGIAPAAIITAAIKQGVITDQTLIDTCYIVITGTVILSSLRIFLWKQKAKE